MRELLIATRNEGKMPEIRHALEGVQFHIIDINEAGKTGGEMSVAEKNRYSHRGKALAKAREILTREFV